MSNTANVHDAPGRIKMQSLTSIKRFLRVVIYLHPLHCESLPVLAALLQRYVGLPAISKSLSDMQLAFVYVSQEFVSGMQVNR